MLHGETGFFPTNIGDVLGNIKERDSGSKEGAGVVPPSAAPAPGTFFPEATHRKQSKVRVKRY